ncbi:MAG: DEAD/DEAH box helicase [Candidatus Micrarchaeota archaeon]|nr:DEAD/DEAH box helicase [Candidatus Micrarchaeota archaeon]MCX8154785.1 DEAD/DEAH box helicase [Candidatus Micrarchaeota archaeon]
MIKYIDRIYTDSEIYDILDEDVGLWFRHTYRSFTPPQRYAIPYIANRKNVLVSSPTGSGKTLSAFLGIIDELVKIKKSKKLKTKVYSVYVSPLRALNNDMERNLQFILDGLSNYYPHNISIGVWTSDTESRDKTRMKKNPPHILITTPESLLLMLSSQMIDNLKDIEWFVVDEIHALADNKRGTNLAISMERLSYYRDFTRIGLSATVAPLDEVARFLVGANRECYIADVSYSKLYDIRVDTVAKDFIRDDPDEVGNKLIEYLIDRMNQERSVLIFTNTRSGAEGLGFSVQNAIRERSLNYQIGIHHSSLSREERLTVERMMKNGELKGIFSSTSLELGIDIGDISLVILLNSPKSSARALQRIGRAGHNLGQTSRGLFLATDLDVFLENLVINRMIYQRRYDTISIPKNSLDVLAQHIISVGYQPVPYTPDEFYEIVRSSYPYSDLSYDLYMKLVDTLKDGYKDMIRKKISIFNNRILSNLPRMVFYMNAGTISEDIKIPVKEVETDRYIGSLDEKYAKEIRVGDIFVLSGKPYRMVGTHRDTIIVKRVDRDKPNIPAWFSEALPLSYEIALEIEKFRKIAQSMSVQEISEYLGTEMKYAEQIKKYIEYQKTYTRGIVPDTENLLIENWYEDTKNLYLFHYVAGKRVNEAISKAYMNYIAENITEDMYVAVSDYGFIIAIPESYDLEESDLEYMIDMNRDEFLRRLKEVVFQTQRFSLKFKDVLMRMFAIISSDLRVSPLNVSNRILESMIDDRDNVFINETYNEIMNIDFRVDQAIDYMEKLRHRRRYVKSFQGPSPFALNVIYNSNSGDRLEVKDKRRFLLDLIQMLEHEDQRHNA